MPQGETRQRRHVRRERCHLLLAFEVDEHPDRTVSERRRGRCGDRLSERGRELRSELGKLADV
jgi:hypothetical protein